MTAYDPTTGVLTLDEGTIHHRTAHRDHNVVVAVRADGTRRECRGTVAALRWLVEGGAA